MDGIIRNKSAWALVVSTFTSLVMPLAADAQQLTPMRKEVRSFGKEFALKVHPKNPYRHRIKVTMHVYDHKFRPIKAIVRPSKLSLGGGGTRPVQVIIPFNGKARRKVRVCAMTTPFPNAQTQVSTRVCGKFLAKRVR